MRALLIVPALVILTGCAMSSGQKVDLEAVKRFRPGVSTRAEIEAQLGRPNTVQTAGGRTTVAWSWARGTSFGGGESQVVTMQFDAAGVLVAVPSVSVTRV